jgi:hypothetical protein
MVHQGINAGSQKRYLVRSQRIYRLVDYESNQNTSVAVLDVVRFRMPRRIECMPVISRSAESAPSAMNFTWFVGNNYVTLWNQLLLALWPLILIAAFSLTLRES